MEKKLGDSLRKELKVPVRSVHKMFKYVIVSMQSRAKCDFHGLQVILNDEHDIADKKLSLEGSKCSIERTSFMQT